MGCKALTYHNFSFLEVVSSKKRYREKKIRCKYDQNGNLTKDKNKDIGNIKYNHLNFPTLINFGGGNKIQYFYDASGVKQKKIVTNNGNVKITDYAGNYIYENDQLQFLGHPEGYVISSENSWAYIYQYKDHLGSVRLTYSDSNNNGTISQSEIIKESNYYPFGLEHKGYNNVINGVENNYKTYQGQELTKDLDYNMLEFKYRHYDPAIARFVTIDPLASNYEYNSTYAFQENKLGMGVELEGLELSSQRSKDGKSVTLTYRVKSVNNSNILTGKQFNTLVSARASQTASSLSGDAGDGVTVTTNVVQDSDATIVWEYNDALDVDSTVGQALGEGHTEEVGNTQENKTQVSVPNVFTFDENGEVEFTDENVQNATTSGTHEDGHVGGLNHPNSIKNKALRKKVSGDKNNLMKESGAGTNLVPEQRKKIINQVEQQQPK